MLAAAWPSRHSARAVQRPTISGGSITEVKTCAPMCTVGCVHRVAQVDELRQNPERALAQWFSTSPRDPRPALPTSVKILQWAFVTGPRRDLFRTAAARVFGVERPREPSEVRFGGIHRISPMKNSTSSRTRIRTRPARGTRRATMPVLLDGEAVDVVERLQLLPDAVLPLSRPRRSRPGRTARAA